MTTGSVGVAVILTQCRWPEVLTSTTRRAEDEGHAAQDYVLMSERIVAYRLDGQMLFVTALTQSTGTSVPKARAFRY